MNIIARLEYELAYYDSAVHRFNHYTTRTPHEDTYVVWWVWRMFHLHKHVFREALKIEIYQKLIWTRQGDQTLSVYKMYLKSKEIGAANNFFQFQTANYIVSFIKKTLGSNFHFHPSTFLCTTGRILLGYPSPSTLQSSWRLSPPQNGCPWWSFWAWRKTKYYTKQDQVNREIARVRWCSRTGSARWSAHPGQLLFQTGPILLW